MGLNTIIIDVIEIAKKINKIFIFLLNSNKTKTIKMKVKLVRNAILSPDNIMVIKERIIVKTPRNKFLLF